MKKLIPLALYTIAATKAGSVETRSRKEYDNNFISRHVAPHQVIDRLKEHTDFFLKINAECRRNCNKIYKHLAWRLGSLPNYYVKRNTTRILGRELLHACIQKHNLNRLTIPKKYLYHIPGTGTELNDNNYWVIAEEVKKSSAPSIITLEDAKQISTLVRCSGFMDFHRQNIVQTGDGKIAIIDSETKRIKGVKESCSGLEIIFHNRAFNLNTSFTQDALRHIIMQVGECGPLSKKRYQKILRRLKKQPKPHKWDYVSFFKNLYPQ